MTSLKRTLDFLEGLESLLKQFPEIVIEAEDGGQRVLLSDTISACNTPISELTGKGFRVRAKDSLLRVGSTFLSIQSQGDTSTISVDFDVVENLETAEDYVYIPVSKIRELLEVAATR